ncbi:hypothetical protein PsorP6_006297 [Peronosclerospora sorghi]|uniref:Uncharacterized protein n=1 Tax=Peronosclerospora sorghi TaxID=230839 RepID=A0ACC0W2J2_9STRA|nr:hypothetical protein PsorP6_006297 [Peronosclerospora sorghi]
MSEDKMKEWFMITKEVGAHVWLNGHNHGFNHDISNWGTHFYETGGGIQSETSGMPPEVAEKYVEHAWIASGNPYGFFMLHFSEEWLKTELVTFDNSWTFSVKKEEIKKVATKKATAGTFRSLSVLKNSAPPAKTDCKYALHWHHLHIRSSQVDASRRRAARRS